MDVQLISDIHVEFHEDSGRAWALSLPVMSDILVIAGDFGTQHTWREPMSILASRFKHIIYVLGNHEYDNASFEDVHADVAEFCSTHKNVVWLNNDVYVLDGIRFIGSTLWFAQPDKHDEQSLARFSSYDLNHRESSTKIFEVNERAQAFLRSTVREGDVVITHHIPTRECVSSRFVTSALNCFFVCDMQDIFVSLRPKVWIHGHTHDSHDRIVGTTRVVCNPHGKVSHGVQLNLNFDDRMLIEV